MTEPLLKNTHNKFTTFPIIHQDIWDYYLTHKRSIWFAHEIDLTSDLKYWKNMSENVKFYIKNTLAFFAASDGIVMENLACRFLNEVQVAEARHFYTMQMFIEQEHSLMYSLLIDTYIEDASEKFKLFNAIEHMPAIKQKAEWANKWIKSCDNFATRLIAFAVVEGIFFSGSFCCIYWLSEQGIMPGLVLSNQFIARDEGLHCDFATLLYTRYIVNKLEQQQIHQIIHEAVEIEKYFISEALPCSLIGMNSDLMKDYIEFVADRLMKLLGYEAIYNANNPFPFMERICLQGHTNFFEHRPTEYQKDVNYTLQSVDDDVSFDSDF